MFSIKATTRDLNGNLDSLRKSGFVPSVFYGMGKNSTPISVPKIDFKKVWREAGESSAIKMSTPVGDVNVLIQDVQTDPVTDEPIHVDFLVIDMNKKVAVKVPIEFVGVSPAVKSGIGNLVKVLHEIEIEALPADLPHKLEADISKLETLDNTITVLDIKMPTGVVAITPDAEIVASIIAQVEEKESAPIDLSAIEVEKKGKKEEEGSEAATESTKEA
jgi:large subunit ribosomal protein L25